MRRFARRTALVALVWLTAASTLLAGLPQLECACPTTRGEARSPDAKPQGKRCCCSCCAPEPGEPEGRHSCCRHQGQEPRPGAPRRPGDGPGKAPRADQGQQPGDEKARSPELTHSPCARTLAPSANVPATAKTEPGSLPALELL